MNVDPKLALVDLVDDMLVEIGVRLDPASLLSLSRVSSPFYRLFSPVLRRVIKETKYCKHMGVALGMAASMALLRWASLYFQPLVNSSHVVLGAVEGGHYEFLLECASDLIPACSEFPVSVESIHRAAGRSGCWDLILYLQRSCPQE